jgi:hypothetical protein
MLAHLRQNFLGQQLDAVVPVVVPESQIENEVVDADFQVLLDASYHIVGRTGDERTFEVFPRLE